MYIYMFFLQPLIVFFQVIWALAVNFLSIVTMSVYGLTGCPSRCCLRTPVGGLGPLKRVSALPSSWKPKDKIAVTCLERYCLIITG